MEAAIIQCVIVLYQRRPQDSSTLQSLIAIASRRPDIRSRFAIVIYDNSPQDQHEALPLFQSVVYFHNPGNPGLQAAYEFAMVRAKQATIEWLLLLDQDTELTEEFLDKLLVVIEAPLTQEVGSVIPRLERDDLILSPEFVGKWRNHPVGRAFQGQSTQRLTALNAAACVRIEAIRRIGGFPKGFPLDYQDHAMFFALHVAGYKSLVLDTTLRHQLAHRSLETEMNPTRYMNARRAEWRFVRQTRWGGGPLVHRIRLVRQALRLLATGANKRYVRLTLLSAFSRITRLE